jgi:DNA repair photolyase
MNRPAVPFHMSNLRTADANLPTSLRTVVDYRKSGLSLNHIVGCPLECAYCVRHLFSNYDMKRPHLIMDDIEAVDLLVSHWAFRPGVTPIQLLNRATDPFLPGVKEHLFSTLEELDRRNLTNLVLVITRWRVEIEDVIFLERLRNIRLTILVTWSGIDDDRLEPVDSGIAEGSLKALKTHASKTKAILYWRPLIASINDSDAHLERARQLSTSADATVFTGLFYRDEIREYLRQVGLNDFYDQVARRKVLPLEIERRVLEKFKEQPIFRKTSCGVAFAHGVADYNGHRGIPEICDICPAVQVALCSAAHSRPALDHVRALARMAKLERTEISIDERRVEVMDSSEQQRYFIQHMLNYQVHDRQYPHLPLRHGRAGIGWE